MKIISISNAITRWISVRYGSRRGLIRTFKHRVLGLVGAYRKYKCIDWSQVNRLVFVCKGNICRSAFAEAVAKTLNIETISCGIDTNDDKPANDKAISMAANKGFDLSGHKTRKISSIELMESDLLITMEPYQVEYIEKKMGDKYAFTMMGLWGMPALPYIHDPYGASNEYYKKCFDYIETSVRIINKNINESRNQ